MIVINLLKISTDKLTLDVSVSTSVGETIQSVDLWTDKTFKNYSLAVDLSSKLLQVDENEVFSVTPKEAGIGDVFEGILFLEFVTSDITPPTNCSSCDGKIALGVVADFTNFQECVLAKVLKLSNCGPDIFSGGGCGNAVAGDIINTNVVLDAMKYALQSGYYAEAINFKKKLDILCSKDCYQCDDLSDPVFKTGLNYCTIDNTLILQ